MRLLSRDASEILPAIHDEELAAQPGLFFEPRDAEGDGAGGVPRRAYWMPLGLEPRGPVAQGMDTSSLASVLRAADRPVLLTGDSGSGKTLVTLELLHRVVRRDSAEGREFRFVRVASQFTEMPDGRVSLRHGDYLLAALRGQGTLGGDVERARAWVENATGIAFVLDVNRADYGVAKRLIADVVAAARTPEWERHRFIIIYRPQSGLLHCIRGRSRSSSSSASRAAEQCSAVPWGHRVAMTTRRLATSSSRRFSSPSIP